MRSEDSMKLIEPLIARPRDAGLLLVGFKAWAVSAPQESELSMREQLSPASSRAVWNLRGRPDSRIALTASEHASVRDALRALAGELEANQLATLPQGPSDLGEISFVHPRGIAPPAAFFVSGNMTLGVFSFGREPIDVVPFAQRVDADLRARPSDARDGGLDLTYEAGGLRARPRFAGPDGFLKVIAPGSDLRNDGGTIAGATGEVEVYYLEAGRETYSARVRR